MPITRRCGDTGVTRGKHLYYVKEPGPPGLFTMTVEGGQWQQFSG